MPASRQTLDAQIAALKAAGAERIFSEKQSGAKTDRAALAKARRDRLAKSTSLDFHGSESP
jgi:DNA invertase Pin-like site-specific DNA recombinase